MKLLLLTSNVGSLFIDKSNAIQDNWMREIKQLIIAQKPAFVAIHFQEVGGKDYGRYISQVDSFLVKLAGELLPLNYSRGKGFIDDAIESSSYTALGSIYFVHDDLMPQADIYDFKTKNFVALPKYEVHKNKDPTMKQFSMKERFANAAASRKGFLWAQFRFNQKILDFVNVHLSHDACNLTSLEKMPSVYSSKRKEALHQTLSMIAEEHSLSKNGEQVPLFVFGDFNFRLDVSKFIEDLTKNTDKVVRQPSTSAGAESNAQNGYHYEFRMRSNNELLLRVGSKMFDYRKDLNGMKIKNYDWESRQFDDKLFEAPINFTPSYPYAEDLDKPSEFMTTRPPAYCDRVMMNKFAWQMTQNPKASFVYDLLAKTSCVGDHKPVFLALELDD